MYIGPLTFSEIHEPRPWGGRALARLAGKKLPPGVPIGESWEISDGSVVRDGPLEGKTLKNLMQSHAASIVGDGASKQFPLLAKLIHAEQWLSVQVHPDDACARRMKIGRLGKTEAWYILDARKGGEIITGLTKDCRLSALRDAAESGEIATQLKHEPGRAGDVWFCPAGAVHVIGPGLLIFEVQQNADVTFRLYDWGRVGLDGKPRQLHIEQAIRAIGKTALSMTKSAPKRLAGLPFPAARRVRCEQFVMDDWRVARAATRVKQPRFEILHVVRGHGVLTDGLWPPVRFKRGMTLLVPATVRHYDIRPAGNPGGKSLF